MTKVGQPALATLRSRRLQRTPVGEALYQLEKVVKPWDRRFEDEAPYRPPGSDRKVRMPEKPPEGSPFALVETVFLSRHLAWSRALAVKKHFLEREHIGFEPKWEMFGPDELGPLADDEPRVYHVKASRLYMLRCSGGVERLRDVTFDWMRRVGEDAGGTLRWAAFIHTKRFLHVHVLIRGLDEANGLLYFPDPYIANGLRWQLQHALAQALGTSGG